jgi:hypothetical protein
LLVDDDDDIENLPTFFLGLLLLLMPEPQVTWAAQFLLTCV